MPTTIYDSSLITQRHRDKAISGSFINRIQNQIKPTTGSAPLLGISEQSIINTVKNGQMTTYRKNEGGCTTESLGCPCNVPSLVPLPSLQSIQLTAQWATYFNMNVTTFQGISITNDSLNNIYMTGVYSSGFPTIIQNALGNGQSSSSIIMPPIPNAVPFLIKYNSAGIVEWATYLNGPFPTFNYSTKVICDSLNNIYISGAYESGIPLEIYNALGNGQTLSAITLPAAPSGAAFLVKYSPVGQAQKATYLDSSTGYDLGDSISVDLLDNIYMTGRYQGNSSVTVQDALGNGQTPSAISLPGTLPPDAAVFLIKYNSNVEAQWATYFDGAGYDYSQAISFDSLNNIYISGVYQANAQVVIYDALGNGQAASLIRLPATTNNAAFLVKYNLVGKAQWATYLDSVGDDTVNSLSIDSSDNIYITGKYNGNSLTIYNALGNGQVSSTISLPATTTDAAFLVKYTSGGQGLWATYLNASVFASGESVAVDSFDNIYISGSYKSGSSIFVQNVLGNGQTPSSITLPTLSSDATFLIKYDSNGQAQKATYFNSSGNTGGLQDDAGSSISIDSSNNIYLSGVFVPNSLIPIQNALGNSQTPSYVTISANNVIAYAFLIKYN